MSNHIVSVAPMLDYTDRHCRCFLRLISAKTLLYTEMITTGAILHGNKEHLLSFDNREHPIALQVGGNQPDALAKCTKIASEEYGYDEINLNVGCPSSRVKEGRFGACLMLQPELVAECVAAMSGAANIPVTVKTRIGVDHQDSYEALSHFISTVSKASCHTFIIHARKAWLEGLSPKQNREIPPLKYEIVYQLKKDFPNIKIILNGGVKTIEEMKDHLQTVDGVMIGRGAYQNPYLLSEIDRAFYGCNQPILSREEILLAFLEYVDKQLKNKVPLKMMTRHILNLYHQQPRARVWRRYLSENAYLPNAGREVVQEAIKLVKVSLF